MFSYFDEIENEDNYNNSWYADDGCPYMDEPYCCVDLNDFLNFIVEKFIGKTIKKVFYFDSVRFKLYRNDDMGHNVETRMEILREKSAIKEVKIYSFDKGIFEEDGFIIQGLKESNMINNLQIYQVLDYLNNICETKIRYF